MSNDAESPATEVRERTALRVVALCTAMFTTIYAFASSSYQFGSLEQPGPALYPVFVVVPLLVLVSIGLWLEARSSDPEAIYRLPDRSGILRIMTVLLTNVIYLLMFRVVGHAIAAAGVVIVMFRVMRISSIIKAVVAGLAIGAGSQFLFVNLLGAALPTGPWPW